MTIIINEQCYAAVKKTLAELQRGHQENLQAGIESSGGLMHEIEIRQKDVLLYEGLRSGEVALPDLNKFRQMGELLLQARLAKRQSVLQLAEKCKSSEPEMTDIEIAGFEIYDYLPAKYDEMMAIAIEIEHASRDDGDLQAEEIKLDEAFETKLEQWKKERDAQLRKYFDFLSSSCWSVNGKAGLTAGEVWLEKRAKCSAGSETELKCSELLNAFPDALVMWRLAKKWSYRQLADSVGIDWLAIWFLERNSYHGAYFALMLKIAAVVEHGEHEASENSFPADFMMDETEMTEFHP